MKFELSLNEQDYLNQVLFIASKSEAIKKRNRINHVITSGVFLLLSIVFYFQGKPFFTGAYFIVGVIVAFFYPLYQRGRYKRFYLKQIRADLKGRNEIIILLDFQEDVLIMINPHETLEFNLNAIEHIYETADYFFLKFAAEEMLTIPKAKVNLDNLVDTLNKVIKQYGTAFSQELEWKWK